MPPLPGPHLGPICEVGGQAGEARPGRSHTLSRAALLPTLLPGSLQGCPPLCTPLPNPMLPGTTAHADGPRSSAALGPEGFVALCPDPSLPC